MYMITSNNKLVKHLFICKYEAIKLSLNEEVINKGRNKKNSLLSLMPNLPAPFYPGDHQLTKLIRKLINCEMS